LTAVRTARTGSAATEKLVSSGITGNIGLLGSATEPLTELGKTSVDLVSRPKVSLAERYTRR
jgi:hypothetical protein